MRVEVSEVAGVLLHVVTYWLLLSSVGWDRQAALYPAVGLTLLNYVLSKFNVHVKDYILRSEYSKPLIINVEGRMIYQRLSIRGETLSSVFLNLSGAVMPVLVGVFLFAKLVTSVPVKELLLYFTTALALLIYLYNRLTKFITGRGLGLPVVTAVILTLLLGCVLAVTIPTELREYLVPLIYFSVTLATLIGVDLTNLRELALFNARYIVIGGLGSMDLVSVLPSLTASLLYSLLGFLG